MAMWKHYIVLFGGFIDPGFTSAGLNRISIHRSLRPCFFSAKYLNDTWIFDTQDYKWRQIEFKDVDRKPSCVTIPSSLIQLTIVQHSPRSGFSFLPTQDGILLHGLSFWRLCVPEMQA